jgi:hypothetical protein
MTFDQPANCGGESDAGDGWDDVNQVHGGSSSRTTGACFWM